MELRLGFEPLDDYLKYELYKGAMKLVQDVMLAKPGETVMVTADTSTDMRVANALAAAASGRISDGKRDLYRPAASASGSGLQGRCVD